MEQDKELMQEELIILSAPMIKNRQLSDNSASSSLEQKNEEIPNSKLCDTPVERIVNEFQLQSLPVVSISPELEHLNLEVIQVASLSTAMLSESLKEGRKVDSVISDSHLICNRNSREIGEGSKKTGGSCTVDNVDFVNLTVAENVTFIDLTVNSDGEQENELQKVSSAFISRKHAAKSRHVPYSAKLSRHTHLRTISCMNQNSIDPASFHLNSHADLITNKKPDSADATETLVGACDQLSKGEGAKLDLKLSTDPMKICNQEQLEISTDILTDGKGSCQSHEPMNMSLRIEIDHDCPLGNNDSINISSVNETSYCFENMSLRVSDDEEREDASSAVAAASVTSIRLPGTSEQSYTVRDDSLRNEQQKGGSVISAANNVLLKNSSDTDLCNTTQHAGSVANDIVASISENGCVIPVQASKDVQQRETNDNIQHRTCNSADASKNMPLGISKESLKNRQNNSAPETSLNIQQTVKSANISKDSQKENCSDVIISIDQQSINGRDASEKKGQNVNVTGVLNAMESKSSNTLCLSSNAQQSSNAVDASKNKEQKVFDAAIVAKCTQQRYSCATSSSANVQQTSNSAVSSKLQQTSSSADKPFKTTQQQNASATPTVLQRSISPVQPPKPSGSDCLKEETQQENARSTKLGQTAQKQSGPVFKHPNILRPGAQKENINSCAQEPSRKIDSSENKITITIAGRTKSARSLLSINNIQYKPLQDCQDLQELASCKTTDYRVHQGKPKHILEESSRANTFERFKNFRFSRATDNDVQELYGRLPVSLPEDLEETPMCKEDIKDFTLKKNKVQDLEKVLHNQKH